MKDFDFSKLDLAISLTPESDKPMIRNVVRLSTSYWYDKRGIHLRKDITFLRRKSSGGYDMLSDEASNIGAMETIQRIENLDACEDGIYEVITCNHYRDWETGNIEDYDFQLIPYEETDETKTVINGETTGTSKKV